MRRVGRFLVHEVRLFFVALQFFTRVPVPRWVGYEPAWLQASIRHAPAVGLCVGTVAALALGAACLWWPPSVAVLLSMAATLWMTGAFHEDGWADTCDGLGGAVPRERALEIMKDSRLGTYGVAGLAVLLALKACVLVALVSPRAGELTQAQDSHVHQVLLGWTMMAVLWSHTASRIAPVLLIRCLSYAGDIAQAKAKPLSTRVSDAGVLAALGWAMAVSAGLWVALQLAGWPEGTLARAMGWATFAVLMATVWCGRWFRRRLGGYTGDTLGASQQLAELASLLAWLAVVHPETWVRW